MIALDIFVVTYNRAQLLKKTLDWLSNSALRECNVTVLNNCSTDDTIDVVRSRQARFPKLQLITHRCNIGGDANIMRALELGKANYTWVLCDDDELTLNAIDDLLHVINSNEVDLIHVGAHDEVGWTLGGNTLTPNEALKEGYHYFKAGSFLPCNIFRTAAIQPLLMAGYYNLVNRYGQMPFLYQTYKADRKMYFTKSKLVTAYLGEGYTVSNWFMWWLRNSMTFKEKDDVRTVFFDHFEQKLWVYQMMIDIYIKDKFEFAEVMLFVEQYFLTEEKKEFMRHLNAVRNAAKRQQIKDKVKSALQLK